MYLVRDHIERQPEMIQDLIPAARERFGDAQACFANGSPTGAVYLAGYCVEMTLKHGALRAEGLLPFAQVRGALAPARARLTVWLGPVDHEAYHSLEFWSLLLRETFRNRKGRVPGVIQQASRRAGRLHEGWRVAMRYYEHMIPAEDARVFLLDAGWFVAKAEELWR